MESSKLTSRYQATIPKAIRELLSLEHGDRIIFEVEDGKVILQKSEPIDWEYLHALPPTLNEWKSNDDDDLIL